MHPRLDEIRKRLLTVPEMSNPGRYKAPSRPSAISPQITNSNQVRNVEKEETEQQETGATTMLQSATRTGSLSDHDVPAENLPPRSESSELTNFSNSTDGLAGAVAELFHPARECQARPEEITGTADAITYLTRLAVELREPLKTFHDHIRKLSGAFESMRTFRDELGDLAESFTPVRALHQQVIDMAQTVRRQLADVAKGLEPARALRIQIAQLAVAIDSVSELQARFYELSKAFGDTHEPPADVDFKSGEAGGAAEGSIKRE